MSARFSLWTKSIGGAAVLAAGLLSVGCGRYEPEPEYPQQYQYVAPPPPTSAELAQQQQAGAQAAATESGEVQIGADADEYSDTDPSALTEFKPSLDGHGAWVDDSTYGTVWVPAPEEVGADFQPYVTAGHWTYSEDTDYVWVSDYSWGWAPFHYGRWVFLPGHGWAWIPGRRYAGAWVTWRVGGDGYGYVGWAPAPPDWYWYQGVAVGWSFGWYHHHDYYVYCPHSHFYGGTVSTYAVRGSAAREHYGRTHDYAPARPDVGGDRRVATPSVNGSGTGTGDRVPAHPGVGGAGRIPAKPGVARGPRPDELGLKNDSVVAPPSSHQGLNRAQAFASPSTAVAAGGAPPAHLRPSAAVDSSGVGGIGASNRAPASAAFVPGGSRSIASASAQPNVAGANSPSARPPYTYRAPPSYVPPSQPTPPPVAHHAPPSIGSSPSYRSAPPVVRSTPSFGSSSSPSVRSSPPLSAHSTPSFSSSSPVRSSPPVVRSTPSFGSSPSHSSTPPVVRSTPSVAPPRPSSPSRPAAPSRSVRRK